MKVFFISYWKYKFIVKDENGYTYELDDDCCNHSDIYRLSIDVEMQAERVGSSLDKIEIDGLPFIKTGYRKTKEELIVENTRKCPTCGCFMGNCEIDSIGECDTEYQCNNEKCASNNTW